MLKIKALDALTVVVLIEHLDPDETIVEVWHTYYRNDSGQVIWLSDPVTFLPAPINVTMCLRCLLNMVGACRTSDGRADLLKSVKDGRVQVVDVQERTPDNACKKCGPPELRPFQPRGYP